MNSEKLYFIWLSAAAPTGSPLGHLLLKYFGSAEAVYRAGEADLAAVPIEWRGRMTGFLNKDLSWAQRVLDYCETSGVAITTISDHFYPQRLRALSNPPLLFYHIGAFCDLDNVPSVTVVGARAPSAYGERAAKRLCVDLARGGVTLVSGLARGIDGISHRAALWCETFTVGVLGCGIDRAYPPEHRDLIAEVAAHGLVLTEYAPGTPPNSKNFPMRNRILAALSPVTLVVEASAGSGSLITAEHAIRLNRSLYTVPSPIFSATGAGTNHLLHCGARAALRAEDILSELARSFPALEKTASSPEEKPAKTRTKTARTAAFAFPGSRKEQNAALPEFGEEPPKSKSAGRTKKKFEKCSILDLTEEERALLSRLTHEPVSVELLADGTIGASKLLGLLSSLEIKGYTERVSGNRFCLVDESE